MRPASAFSVTVPPDCKAESTNSMLPETLPALARRIVLVTFISVLFVATGVAFRTGSLL